MRLRNRFFLISFGFLVFIIATPLLILYARGFQYDFHTHQLIETGSLLVDTDPSGARVLLNNQKSNTTPTTIRFLKPGDYQVSIELNGYQTWTKHLSVRSQLVTWAAANDKGKVTLFFSQPKKLSEETTNNLAAPSASQTPQILSLLQSLHLSAPEFTNGQMIQGDNQVFLILDQTLYVVNGTLQQIYAPVTMASYDSSSRHLLYANNNEIYLYDPSTQSSELILRTLTQITNPVLNNSTGYVFYATDNNIKAIELDGRDQRNIFPIVPTDSGFQSFSVSDNGDKLTVVDTNKTFQYSIR